MPVPQPGPLGLRGHERAHVDGLGRRGAARLLRADPRRSVLLLERLTTEDLDGLWDEEAVAIAAGLVLFLITLVVNMLARLVVARYRHFSGADA